MSDDELLQLATQKDTLLDVGVRELETEIQRRGLQDRAAARARAAGLESRVRKEIENEMRWEMYVPEGDLHRWLFLRAVEWIDWPVFLSQPVVPILLIFYGWRYVFGALIIIDLLWAFIRYSFVSPSLSNFGAKFVTWIKWPATIGSAIYLLFVVHRYGLGIVVLVWAFTAGLVTMPGGRIGRVELALAKCVGYADKDAELGL
jgi:hypothetical protein